MNSFRLTKTVIVKSEMDFTGISKQSIKQSVTLSTATMTPKNAAKNRKAYCKVSLELGEKDDEIRMRVEALVEFEIANLSDLSTLRKDSAKYCSRKAIEDVIKKVEKLTEIHLGEPLHIPLPPDVE